MKKKLTALLALLLCLSMVFIGTSCSAKHPIEAFKEKMEQTGNYEMTVTMSDVPLLGTMTITTQVDGNIQHTPAVLFNNEQYTETIDNTVYTYTKNEDGTWEKTESAAEEDSSDITKDENLDKLFDPNKYEAVKGEKNTYKQKKDEVFGDFSDVTLSIGEDTCTFEMTSTSEGMTYGIKLVISKIGEIDLTLPAVE